MSRIGLERPIRSSLWLSAVLGPYVNLITYNLWNSPVVSHIAGFGTAILTFILSFLLEKTLERNLKHIK
jgi:hypothetical protein